MGKRSRIHPLFIAGGVVAIVVLFLIFTPAILGATAAGNDLEKYNGTSQQGNETVRIGHAINTYFVGIAGIPLTLAAFATAIFVAILAMLWLLKSKKSKHG
jgi:hypothetical protein